MEILQPIFAIMAMRHMEETGYENVEMMVIGLARHQSASDVSYSH